MRTLALMQFSSAWEQEAQVGPLVILPAIRSGPLPAESLPPVLSNIIKPYGSQWRGGIRVGKNRSMGASSSGGLTLTCVHRLDQQKAPLPEPPSPDQEEDQTSEEESSGEEIKSKLR